MKNGVKLRACDDRLCEECYEANEVLLRKQRGGVTTAETALATSAARDGKKKSTRRSSPSLSSLTQGTRKNPSSVLAIDSDSEPLYSDNEAIEPLRETVAKLHSDIANLHEIIAAMRGEINDLKEQLEASKSDKAEISAKPVEVRSTDANRPVNRDDVYTAVHKVMHDSDKRKRHVIVSGMVENSYINDSTAFTNICEEQLNIKPAVASCTRLGICKANEPRRLLVRLYREDAVTELLKFARFLQKADDPMVKNVYVNPDLAPAADKLAYEKRQRRRQRRSTTATSSRPTSQHSSTENHRHLPTSNCNVSGSDENGGESNNAVTDVQSVVYGSQHDFINKNRGAKMQSTLNPNASPFPTTN